MKSTNMAEMFHLMEKAKMLEKMGKESDALDIYLQIHEGYYPNTTLLFERPIILLEKKRMYREAKELCENAIRLIGEGRMTGTVDNFQKRLDRISEKLGGPTEDDARDGEGLPDSGKTFFKARKKKRKTVEEDVTKDDAEADDNADDTDDDEAAVQPQAVPSEEKTGDGPTPSEERELLLRKPESGTGFKVNPRRLAAILSLSAMIIVALVYIVTQASKPQADPFRDMYIDTSKLFSEESALTGKSIFKDDVDPDMPRITQKMVEKTIAEMDSQPGVIKSHIFVSGDTIGLVVKPDPLVTADEARQMGDRFVRMLSGYAALYESVFSPSTLNNYGKLYTYYNTYVVVKPGDDLLLAEGILIKSSPSIYWKKADEARTDNADTAE